MRRLLPIFILALAACSATKSNPQETQSSVTSSSNMNISGAWTATLNKTHLGGSIFEDCTGEFQFQQLPGKIIVEKFERVCGSLTEYYDAFTLELRDGKIYWNEIYSGEFSSDKIVFSNADIVYEFTKKSADLVFFKEYATSDQGFVYRFVSGKLTRK